VGAEEDAGADVESAAATDNEEEEDECVGDEDEEDEVPVDVTADLRQTASNGT